MRLSREDVQKILENAEKRYKLELELLTSESKRESDPGKQSIARAALMSLNMAIERIRHKVRGGGGPRLQQQPNVGQELSDEQRQLLRAKLSTKLAGSQMLNLDEKMDMGMAKTDYFLPKLDILSGEQRLAAGTILKRVADALAKQKPNKGKKVISLPLPENAIARKNLVGVLEAIGSPDIEPRVRPITVAERGNEIIVQLEPHGTRTLEALGEKLSREV